MSAQSRKHRGYRSQKVVAERFRRIFPNAEPTGAGRSGADVLATPGVDIEVAARRGFPVVEKMKQIAARAKSNHTDNGPLLGIVVLRPDGMGETTVGDWPAIVRLDDLIDLLKEAGYGYTVRIDSDDL